MARINIFSRRLLWQFLTFMVLRQFRWMRTPYMILMTLGAILAAGFRKEDVIIEPAPTKSKPKRVTAATPGR